jgi:hypothetical protein
MSNRQILKSALKAGPDCLSLEQLEGLTDAQAKAHPHLEQCPRCQAELALLKSFQSDVPLPDEGAAVAWISSQLDRRLDQIKHPTRRTSTAADMENPVTWLARLFGARTMRLWVPVGAVAVLAVAGALLFRAPKEPTLQANLGTGTQIYRSQEVETVGSSGELEKAPATLQWKVFDGAASYKLAMMEIDRSPVWSLETKDFSASLPGSVRVKILPGKTILWQVTALDAQGRVLATSQVQRFTVSPRRSRSND